jgi:hypothetical protein
VEVYTLYRFIEGLTIFGMPKVLKLVWPLMSQNKLLCIRIQQLPPSMHHKWKEVLLIFYAIQPLEIIEDQFPVKSQIEL